MSHPLTRRRRGVYNLNCTQPPGGGGGVHFTFLWRLKRMWFHLLYTLYIWILHLHNLIINVQLDCVLLYLPGPRVVIGHLLTSHNSSCSAALSEVRPELWLRQHWGTQGNSLYHHWKYRLVFIIILKDQKDVFMVFSLRPYLTWGCESAEQQEHEHLCEAGVFLKASLVLLYPDLTFIWCGLNAELRKAPVVGLRLYHSLW